MSSDTPRVDDAAECLPIYGPSDSEWVNADFARQLERDLAACREQLAKSCNEGRGDPEYPICSRAIDAEQRAEQAEEALLWLINNCAIDTRKIMPKNIGDTCQAIRAKRKEPV